MTTSVHFSSAKDEWGTPQAFYETLDAEFGFTLDVCALDSNAKSPVWLTPFDDALSLDWVWVCRDVIGQPVICWMNPPYGRQISKWIAKAVQEAQQGATVVCLVPARTDTEWWAMFWDHKNHCPHPWCREVRFIKGRLAFEISGSDESPAPFPSAIVVLGPDNKITNLSILYGDGSQVPLGILKASE